MTVHGDLERTIAMAEAAKGNYMLFAAESEDNKAKQVFADMAQDMDRHVKVLESRRDYLEQNNQLIQAQGSGCGQDEQGGQGGGQDQKQNKQKQQKQQQQQQQQC